MENIELNSQQKSLFQQGYDYSPKELKKLVWGLRFTPSICMLFAIFGLITQQPIIHFLLAGLGIIPFWFPDKHPFDRFYNKVVRPLWAGVELPPNPLPRRIACAMGGSMNILIGIAFIYEAISLAYLFGVVLTTLQLVVITTHFCVASWMYQSLMKILGKWSDPLPLEQIRNLVDEDAQFIDVRNPDEFQKGNITGAINIPVGEIINHIKELQGRSIVLYCQSGLRSQEALQLIKRQGHEQVYNLGAMSRWENS